MNSALTSKFKGTRLVIGTSVTADYSFDDIVEAVNADATTGNIIITLPPINVNIGRLLTVRKTDGSANTVTIAAAGGDLIQGNPTLVLNVQWASYTLENDGTQWLEASGTGTSSGINTGDVTLGPVGSTPTSSGASLSGQVLTLQPTDASHPGVLTNGTQTISGTKTFDRIYIGTTPALSTFLNIQATNPADPFNGRSGVSANIVSDSGGGSRSQTGMSVNLQAGYTGPYATAAFVAVNLVQGTAHSLTDNNANFGILSEASSNTTGYNVGIFGASDSSTTLNIGSYGQTIYGVSAAPAVGMLGQAWNTSGPQIGGYFVLVGPVGTNPTNYASAALLADNGITADPIFMARSNGTAVMTINTSLITVTNELRSTVTSGNLAIDLVQGAKLGFDGSSGTKYLSSDGTNLNLTGLNFAGPNLSGTNTGDVILTTVGSSPSANAASLSGQVLTLQPADATHPGVITSGTQTIGGNKTFAGSISASNLSGTNTGDITLAAVGSSPSANAASLSGQVLTLQPADSTNPGVVSTTTQTFLGNKTFSGNINATNLSGTNTGDITLGTIGSSPNANAASLSGQVLTLQPADSTNGGVLTTISQNIAGAKTFIGGVISTPDSTTTGIQINSNASTGASTPLLQIKDSNSLDIFDIYNSGTSATGIGILYQPTFTKNGLVWSLYGNTTMAPTATNAGANAGIKQVLALGKTDLSTTFAFSNTSNSAVYGQLERYTSGNTNGMQGFLSVAVNFNPSGTITTMDGLYSLIGNTGDSTNGTAVTNANAVHAGLFSNPGTGVITNYAGVRVDTPVTSTTAGSIVNAYGVYLADQKPTGVTNAFGFYQVGTNTVNSFDGKLTLNTPTGNPAITLVQGARLGFDAATGAKYISSDGTNLNVTGLGVSLPNFIATPAAATIGLQINSNVSTPNNVALLQVKDGNGLDVYDIYNMGNSTTQIGILYNPIFTTNSFVLGINNNVTMVPTATNTGTSSANKTILALGNQSGATTFNFTSSNNNALYGQIERYTSGNVTNMTAIRGYAVNNNASGTVTTMDGLYAGLLNTGSGGNGSAVTNAYAFHCGLVGNPGTGVITKYAGLQIDTPVTSTTSGSIVNAYGVYVDDQKPTGVTNAFGIFQVGANTSNSFDGKVALNATTGNTALTLVQGARQNFDGATGSKYISSDGTTLTVTGLNLAATNLSGTNTGNVTIGTANGLSLSGQVLSLATAVASGANGALLGTDKTKLDATTGTNSGDVTIGTANGLSLSGQAVSMALATTGVTGAVSAAAQSFDGLKTFNNGVASTTGAFSSAVASSVASGSNAFTLLAGARIKWSDGANAYLDTDGGNILRWFGAAIQMKTAGSVIYTDNIQNNSQSAVAGTQLIIANITSSAGTIPMVLKAGTATTAGNILQIANTSTIVQSTDFAGKTIYAEYTDSSGSPGNVTINKVTGRAAVATGNSTCVVTNSRCTATSIVHPHLESSGVGVANAIVTTTSAGSFTVTTINALGVATTVTGNATFSFTIDN